MLRTMLATLVITSICSCQPAEPQSGEAGDQQTDMFKRFDSTLNGKKTALYQLDNGIGMKAWITNYGGRIVGLQVPDREGRPRDVVVGFSSLEGFIQSTEPYFGATIGRVGNRIAQGKFRLKDRDYTLFTNNGPNTLHGGKAGFQAVVWEVVQATDTTLQLRYVSPDMEEGFPGTLDVTVTYTLTQENALDIRYEATTDKSTLVNLTNHAFFNLNGEGSGSINKHLLFINANQYTPVDSTLIPTGELAAVSGTPFDFTQPTAIGQRLETADEQLRFGGGYDHNFVLNTTGDFTKAAEVTGDVSGIHMEVWTTEPGLQFYGGNFMQGRNRFKSGAMDEYRTAFCLETQHFPDAVHHSNFPDIVLEPGETYRSRSLYKFSVKTTAP